MEIYGEDTVSEGDRVAYGVYGYDKTVVWERHGVMVRDEGDYCRVMLDNTDNSITMNKARLRKLRIEELI